MSASTYIVSGMTCNHCVASVESEIGQVPGVTQVEVDLTTGRVTVSSERPIDDGKIRAAVEEAGYQLEERVP